MDAKTLYLSAYNAACLVGWSYVLFLICEHYFVSHGTPDTLFAVVGTPVKIVQTAAVLEILHAAFGLVRSSVFTTFLQVFSRVGVLWGITNLAPPAATHWCFTLMMLSWGSVEIPRYTYYLVNLFTASPPAALTWLRYHLFIVLYPTGITGEVLSLWNALPYIAATRTWSLSLPNAHNIAFDYHLVLWAMLLTYIPGSYTMYSHMWAQMKKYSAGKPAATAEAEADAPASKSGRSSGKAKRS